MKFALGDIRTNDTMTTVPSAYSPSESGKGASTILPAPFGTTATDSRNRSGTCVGEGVSVGVGLVNGVGDGVGFSAVGAANGVAAGKEVDVGRGVTARAIVSGEVSPPHAKDNNKIITAAAADQRAALEPGAL